MKYFLLVAILLLWMLVWGPKAKAAREERERLAAEARARREAELAKLKAERDDLLKSIRTRAPDFILNARLDFEREYRASGGVGAEINWDGGAGCLEKLSKKPRDRICDRVE